MSEIESSRGRAESSEPLFGASQDRISPQSEMPFPMETVFRYYVGCLNDDVTRAEVSDLMTRSYRSQGVLKNPGDVWVISEAGTFDKNGLYNVVVKYAEIPGKAPARAVEVVPAPAEEKTMHTTTRKKGAHA